MKSKLGLQKRRPISISQNKLLELQNNRKVEAIIIIITTILNKNIIHSQKTKVFQVVLHGWDHQCQNQH